MRHNELHDGVAELTGKAFTPSHVRNYPLIFSGSVMKRTKATPVGASGTIDQTGAPPSEVTEQKEDLLIRDLWQNGMDSVHNMRVINTDAKSHIAKAPEKCLQEAKRGKNRMDLATCLQQRRHILPSFALVDGLLGVEATATMKMLAICLATKWKQT